MSDVYLDEFDKLDLDNKQHRRLAVYAIHEYFGVSMWEIGRGEMKFGDDWKYQNVRDQWQDIVTRLDVVGGIEVPSDYNQIGDRVYEARSRVAYNKNHDPDVSNLESIRSIGPKWREWLNETAQSFSEERGPVSPYDGIVDLILQSVETIKRRPMPSGNPIAMEEAQHMKMTADRIADSVKTVEHNHQNLEKLTRYLMAVITIRKDMHNLSRDPAKYVDPPGPDEPLYYERIDDWTGQPE